MQERPSVYNIGAEDGLIMGAYLSLMFLLQTGCMGSGMIVLLGELMLLLIPVLTYILLKRGYTLKHRCRTFSAIWLHGIITFLCGSLILALVVYVYLRYFDPTFVYRQIKLMSDLYEEIGTPEAHEMAVTLQHLIDKHMLPSPTSMAFSLIWFVGFTGSMLSCLIALIIKIAHRLTKRCPTQ